MKKDSLGLIGLAIGLFGIVLSFYFYEKSKKEREPTFIVDPIKTEILNASSTKHAPIKIFTLDGEEINRDLTSVTFYFWNKGKEPIRKADLLKKVKLKLEDKSRIIDYKIIKESRDVSNISLNQVDDRNIEIDFDILEENDGFTGQIIYEGKKGSKLTLATVIVGVKEVSDFAVSQYQLLGKTLVNIGLGIMAILSLLLLGTGPRRGDPDYEELKHSARYNEDESFKKNVDELEETVDKASEIRGRIYASQSTEQPEEYVEKKRNGGKKWIRILLSIGVIIVLGALYYAWYATKKEINENPVHYIPDSIKPTE
jgi:hypothetical protein